MSPHQREAAEKGLNDAPAVDAEGPGGRTDRAPRSLNSRRRLSTSAHRHHLKP